MPDTTQSRGPMKQSAWAPLRIKAFRALWLAQVGRRWVPRVRVSKERRLEPQITVGLLTDATGFPLSVGAFKGNEPDTDTTVPVINARSASRRHREPHQRQRRTRRSILFDGPVIDRPLGGLLVRLIDRFGVGSGSWSR